jgi:hypothetical protein
MAETHRILAKNSMGTYQCFKSALVSMWIHADPDPVRLLSHKRLNFYIKNILKVIGKKHANVGKINLGQFTCFWILIRIPNTDPVPGLPNQC